MSEYGCREKREEFPADLAHAMALAVVCLGLDYRVRCRVVDGISFGDSGVAAMSKDNPSASPRRSLFAVWRWPLKFQVLAGAVLVILWLATMFTISQFEMFEEL